MVCGVVVVSRETYRRHSKHFYSTIKRGYILYRHSYASGQPSVSVSQPRQRRETTVTKYKDRDTRPGKGQSVKYICLGFPCMSDQIGLYWMDRGWAVLESLPCRTLVGIEMSSIIYFLWLECKIPGRRSSKRFPTEFAWPSSSTIYR